MVMANFHCHQKRWLPFESEGIPAPELVTSMVSIGEMAAGIGIILGGFFSGVLGNVITRLSGGAVVVIMIGAFISHMQIGL